MLLKNILKIKNSFYIRKFYIQLTLYKILYIIKINYIYTLIIYLKK